MTRILTAWTVMFLPLVTGCSDHSGAGKKPSAGIDSALEFQIALRSAPYEEGDHANDGTFRIVSSVVLPVQSDGAAGQVVSKNDGVSCRIQWSHVRQQDGELHFSGFRWKVDNRLVDRHGSRTIGWQGPTSQVFHAAFEPLITPISLRHTQSEIEHGPVLVLRGRTHRDPPPPQIRLED